MISKALRAATGGLKAAAALANAKSVSSAAHAVGDLASAFGFTREIDTRDPMPTRLRSNAGWAATEGSEVCYPLTTDPLAEKTVATDYSIGVFEDELVIAKMAGRYSLATTVDWTAASDTLFSFYVTPNVFAFTCVAATSAPFAYWRGSMKYKLSAVRTTFHKGKLLIKWSPGLGAADASLNTGYSVIWDLDATPEIEIIIPWNRDYYWCRTGYTESTGYDSANGFLNAYVIEPLTGPVDTVTVPIHVFMAGGPDFAVSCPTWANINNIAFGVEPVEPWTQASAGTGAFPLKNEAGREDPLYPQSGERNFDLATNTFILGPQSSAPDAALRSMGEQTLSFRELLKRKQKALTWLNSGTDMKFISTYPKSPLCLVSFIGGFGEHTSSPYDNTLMAYLMPMFMGISGSTKWDFITPGATNQSWIARGFGHPSLTYSMTSPENGQHGAYQGMAVIKGDIDGFASVVAPHYIRGQFTYTAKYYNDLYMDGMAPTSEDLVHTQDNGIFFSCNAAGTLYVTAAVSAGDDFNLLYFLGPPPTKTIMGL